MTDATLLLRQIHPSFVQDGYPTSQAFRPTPKDKSKLSVYNHDSIKPEASFVHYTSVWKLASAGTMALTVVECKGEELPVQDDPLPDCPEHAVIDFTDITDNVCRKKSKKLQARAIARGWLYEAPSIG